MAYVLKQNWLPVAKYPLKSTYYLTPKGIVVHNTSGVSSAADEIAYMIANGTSTSFHVAIDENEVVEAILFNRNAWHGGDGGTGYANRNLLGFEICKSQDWNSDKFARAEENAALYIAYVCIQFGWTSDHLHQHNWYANTDCPHRTKLDWKGFKKKVDGNIAKIKAPAAAEPAEEDPKAGLKLMLHGYERNLDGKIVDGRAYVAVRELLEQMGYAVGFDNGVVSVEYRK